MAFNDAVNYVMKTNDITEKALHFWICASDILYPECVYNSSQVKVEPYSQLAAPLVTKARFTEPCTCSFLGLL